MQFEAVKPESLGIPSGAIRDLLDELEDRRLCLHSFMLLRHGKVAAEGYWPYFNKTRKQRIYSISKSFTAVAVGMMISEGKLSLDSRVSDYFLEHLPEQTHPYVLEATVRDLLMMATCNCHYPYSHDVYNSIGTFFKEGGIKRKPGKIFQYDTVGTTVLCAIVEKLSGKPMLEYMRPVLDEIGFSKDACCIQTPWGGSWTGSGILCTTRDLARFALLCMNEGEWQGRQLLDREYMKAACSKQIDSSVNSFGIECSYGYGYQVWSLRKKGFFMYGMGSQYVICRPDDGTIFINTADTQGVESAGDLIFDIYYRLIGKLSPGALADDKASQKRLSERITSLALPLPRGENETPFASEISGRKYSLNKNEAGMKWLRLLVGTDSCKLQYENKNGEHELIFGMGSYEQQLFPEKYFGKRLGVKDKNYTCIGAGAWECENTLLGIIYSVDDYLGSIKFHLTFVGDEVCGCMTKAAEWFFDEYQGFLSGRCVDTKE